MPSLFVAGKSDWGVHQAPGGLQLIQTTSCTDLRGIHLIDGAGHWVQQERARETLAHLIPFLVPDS